MGLQVIPWLICWAIATLVSLVALYLKVKIFRTVVLMGACEEACMHIRTTGGQLRRRRTGFELDAEDESTWLAKLTKHKKRCSRMLFLVDFYSDFVVVSGSRRCKGRSSSRTVPCSWASANVFR